MDGIYTTTDHSIIVHHEASCIECGGSTSETSFPSSSEAYECDECDIVVAEDGGQSVVRGDVSEPTVQNFSLSE